MDISVWRLLGLVSLITGYMPAIRFQKHKYFYLFLFASFVDPLYLILRMTKIVGNVYHVPYFLTLYLALLPGLYRKQRILFSTFITLLLPHFTDNADVIRNVSLLLSAMIALFLFNEIIDEYRKETGVKYFVLTLFLNILMYCIFISLYFADIGMYTSYFTLFLVLEIATYAFITWAGPERAININLITTANRTKPVIIQNKNISSANKFDNLSPREITILQLIADGLTSKEIADKMKLSTSSIDHSRGAIKTKLKIVTKKDWHNFLDNLKADRSIPDKT